MVRRTLKTNKLTVTQVTAIIRKAKPGRYGDGGNLYLSISSNGGKRWVFLYRWQGRLRELGLGSAGPNGKALADARKAADAHRRVLDSGIDPLSAKAKEANRIAAAGGPKTFGECADQYIAAHWEEWTSRKHAFQWRYSLETLAATLRPKPVRDITMGDVLEVLAPLWIDRKETGQRLRGRIAAVLDAAKVDGHRDGENPAAWRGLLQHKLAGRKKRGERRRHPALPFRDAPAFMGELRQQDSVPALALEFLILTATRSGETRGALWSEIDMANAQWSIPANRMKTHVEHVVPLSKPCLAILEKMLSRRIAGNGDFVFPGAYRVGRPLSDKAMSKVLLRMERGGIVPHGFRSTFRDWASEETGFAHQVCEAALAHTIRSEVEAAYRRGNLMQKRRELMNVWASYLEPQQAGVVVPMRPKPAIG